MPTLETHKLDHIPIRRADRLRRWMLAVSIAVVGAGVIVGPALAQGAGGGGSDLMAEVPKTMLGIAVDEVQVIKLNRSPSIVVVGNPLIADAVIEQTEILLITGRNYGTTNIIALDAQGLEIAHYDISVRTSGSNAVSLFRGTARVSLNCSPRCETELDVGDEAAHFDIIKSEVEAKAALSTAQIGSGR